MDLFGKSKRTLELPAVLELLAAEAVSDPARALARELNPSSERSEVSRRLEETSAARNMLAYKGSPSFSGVRDVRSPLARADMGGVLNTRELLDVAAVLQTARAVRAYGEGAEHSCIDHLFRSLQTNRFLEDKITGSIVGEDELADAASAELADIRRKIRAASARVRDALQKIISSPSYAKALQDPIITTRSDRFVVPVKAEQRGAIPGLVHDVSSSGATLFVEPMAAVKANNELRELRAKEKQEIERILAELSADCAAHRDGIDMDYEFLVRLDLIFAKGKLSDKLDCCCPELSEREVRLRHARHPLLDPSTAVPIDIELGGAFDALVITGPNTGGKTVSLKTLGLLVCMAQCGLHIPAVEGSVLPVFKHVLADIGDEQSIEQSLSTFSAHMKNIVQILDCCGDKSLLLFDELGAGTDPTEGAALAVSILEAARSKGCLIAATTHYAELKIYATNTPGVQNASCEFDVDSLRPTYRLLIGIPGKSNAFAISERLGLPKEIIEDARRRVGLESTSFEETIQKLEQTRRQLDEERLLAAQKRREAEENAKKSARLRSELELRLEMADVKTRREAEKILQEARDTAEKVMAELDALRNRKDSENEHRHINEVRTELRRKLNEAEEKFGRAPEVPAEEKKSARPVREGDVVEILSMGIQATVSSIAPDRQLTLQAGVLRVTAKESEVYLLPNQPKPKKEEIRFTNAQLRAESVSPELDLRGMETIEAIPVLERYIDQAATGHLTGVTIIHGKGTGALRAAVQQSLRKNRQVKSFRLGRYGEGETGVTVVELK
ncbi:MAG: endonuclease MutS2 [Eubacteriales bacterium]|nr:endonuclease MutS2 [Eubacteriales bacterium]